MTIYYVDPVNGNDANDGLSWGTAYKTLINGPSFARLGQADSDEIRIAKSPDPVSIGTQTWTSPAWNLTVSGLGVAVVDNCDSGWSAGLVTPTHNTSYNREGTASVQAVLSSTNGKVCYKTISSADYSAYSRISFMLNVSTAANWTAGAPIQIALCSDTLGATPVHTFTLPSYYYPPNIWMPITIDNVSNMGSGIQSVAIYTTVATTNTIRIDNIIVTGASSSSSSLAHTDLISKGDGKWYPIDFITTTAVGLGLVDRTIQARTAWSGLISYDDRKYYEYAGTQSVTTYKRSCFITAAVIPATATTSAINAINYTNSNVYPETKKYYGGYNTSTNTIDGETWFDGITSYGYGVTQTNSYNASCSWEIYNISAVRYYYNFVVSLGENTKVVNANSIDPYTTCMYIQADTSSTAARRVNGVIGNSFEFKHIMQNAGTVFAGNSSYLPAGSNAVMDSITMQHVDSRGTGFLLSSQMPSNWAVDVTCTGDLQITGTLNSPSWVCLGNISLNNLYTGSGVGSATNTFFIDTFLSSNTGGGSISISGRYGPTPHASYGTILFTPSSGNLTGRLVVDMAGATPLSSISTKVFELFRFPGIAFHADIVFKNGVYSSYGVNLSRLIGNTTGAGGTGHIVFENVTTGTLTNATYIVGCGTSPTTGHSPSPTTDQMLTTHYWDYSTAVTHSGSSALRRHTGTAYTTLSQRWEALPVGQAAYKAGSLVTIAVWVYRSQSTAQAQLQVRLSSSGETLVAANTATVGAWEQLTVTFTPTENGTAFMRFMTRTGNTDAADTYFDDLQVTQA